MPLDLVPEKGVEPSRPCGHRILSPARLPVPPLRRRFRVVVYHGVVDSPPSLPTIPTLLRPLLNG